MTKRTNKILFNANLVLYDRITHGGIEIEDGRISRIFKDNDFKRNGEEIDCRGYYLSPGFIDIHLHGGGGSDFMDATPEAVETIISTHAKYGTTAFVPSTLSSTRENVIKALVNLEKVQKSRKGGPKILGAHLEGNFFSVKQKGAQDPEFIFPPTKENYMPIISCVSNIIMISCAPEIENACEFAAEMKKNGIVMSAAHSDANYDEFEKGVEYGFKHVTHLFNGSSILKSPNYYSQIGMSESALLFDDVVVEVIGDGKHVPKELLKLIYKIKGADGMNLCTDAMCAAGMPEGRYFLGALEVAVEDGVAALLDKTSFAGSVCTTNRAVRTMYKLVGAPLYDAVRMMSATPAKVLGLFDEMGSITVGKAADINVFDEDINIKYTLVNGEVYNDNL